MTGFENHSDGTEQEITVSDTQTAAKAIEGFLDEGPETNPAQGQQGAAEAPAPGEEVEQFGQEFDNPDEPQQPETEQAEAEQEPQQEETGQELEEDDSPLYSVMVQGEEKLVPLEDLTKGYMLQSDYTKKTQSLAQERQEFAQVAQAVTQERQQYTQLLDALEQQLTNGGEPEPDWVELASKDPVGYTRKKAEWDQKQNVLNAARTEKARVAELQKQDFLKRAAEYNNSQVEAMIAAKPELKDPEKAKAYRDELVQYGVNNYGYSEQDMGAITDHRWALILEKAMMYDKAAATGGQVQKNLRTGKHRKVIRPGSAKAKPVVRQKQARQSMERLERTGDLRDAADAMANLL